MRYIFLNVIANGAVDFKSPLIAAHQPSIREAFGILDNGDGSPPYELDLKDSANLNAYSEAIATGAIVVGHSVEYHHGHLRADMITRGTDPHDGRVKTICTMLGLTGHVTKRNGKKGWPTFDEACDHFQITRAGVETAEDNARCLMQVFRGMEAIGAVPAEPKIWKER